MAFRKSNLLNPQTFQRRKAETFKTTHRRQVDSAGEMPRSLLRTLSRQPESLPLADPAVWSQVEDTADRICQELESAAQIRRLDERLRGGMEIWPIGACVAARLAQSRKALQSVRKPVHLSVVVPLFAERRRLLSPTDHPLGEEWLDRKIAQLGWFFGARKDCSWDMLLVDDGCPEGSGHLVQEVLAKRHPNVRAQVLFVEQALRDKHPSLHGMQSANESRKGGAVQLGLWEAAQLRAPGQVILYTDADLSTHLGQSGLLIRSIRKSGILIAAGSRRSPSSIVVKDRFREDRGRLFIYLWKQLVPHLAYLDDTQCGFKAFHPETITPLLRNVREHGFAADFELLARCESIYPRSIEAVPIAWIDSPGASTTTDVDPYLSMLRSIEKISRTCFHREPESEAFARAIATLTQATWQTAIDSLAPRLQNIPPSADLSHRALRPQDLDFASS